MSLLEENADILSDIRDRGANLSTPRSIDFSYLFYDESAARRFQEAIEGVGFSVRFDEAEQDDVIDVTASITLSPTAESIAEAEEMLNLAAQSLGGDPDGWGFAG